MLYRKNLSILLPIWNRPKYTIRTLEYLNKFKCIYKIYIADGSKNKNFDNKTLSKKYSNLDIRYLKFPEDKNYTFFIKKLHKTLSLIKEDYIYWLCDDDFVNLKALNNGLLYLSRNKNFAGYIGIVKSFEIKKEKNKINFKNFYNFEKQLGNNFIKNLNSENILNRIKCAHQYRPSEGILKKNILKEIISLLTSFKEINFYEFMVCIHIMPLILGKFKFSEEIILLRQENTPNSYGGILYSNNIKRLEYFSRSKIANLPIKIHSHLKLEKTKDRLNTLIALQEHVLKVYDEQIKNISASFSSVDNKKYINKIFNKLFNKLFNNKNPKNIEIDYKKIISNFN